MDFALAGARVAVEWPVGGDPGDSVERATVVGLALNSHEEEGQSKLRSFHKIQITKFKICIEVIKFWTKNNGQEIRITVTVIESNLNSISITTVLATY